jgi:ribosomal protein S18 acetylase RimI-like enzyme
MTVEIEFKHLGGEGLKDHEGLITDLYAATYRDELDEPFQSVERFMDRVRAYAKAPRFELVLGSIGDELVGLALGYPLPPGARWWSGLTTPVDPQLIEEDGSRTFALCELMVHPDLQGKGVGHQLHDELLLERPERRATLLVDGDNDAARRAYERWGWRQIGKIRPSWPDAPQYDALILDLPAR